MCVCVRERLYASFQIQEKNPDKWSADFSRVLSKWFYSNGVFLLLCLFLIQFYIVFSDLLIKKPSNSIDNAFISNGGIARVVRSWAVLLVTKNKWNVHSDRVSRLRRVSIQFYFNSETVTTNLYNPTIKKKRSICCWWEVTLTTSNIRFDWWFAGTCTRRQRTTHSNRAYHNRAVPKESKFTNVLFYATTHCRHSDDI